MDKDKVTTNLGGAAGLALVLPAILGAFGIPIPIELAQAIAGLLIALLGYFTNKK